MDDHHPATHRRIQPGISWGNLLSPFITIVTLGAGILYWGGGMSTKVESLATDIKAVKADVAVSMHGVRSEMSDIKATSNAMATTMVGLNYTVSEGLKANMTEYGRRIVNLESRVDRQNEELTALKIELATIRKASEAPGRRQ